MERQQDLIRMLEEEEARLVDKLKHTQAREADAQRRLEAVKKRQFLDKIPEKQEDEADYAK